MRILALVTDAFGGAGGIARYNQDLLTALAEDELVEAVSVMPRFGAMMNPSRSVHQCNGHRGRLKYSVNAFIEAVRFRPDRIFCGHLFMLPLAVWLGRILHAPVWLQLHGIEAWEKPSRLVVDAASKVDMVTSVSRYTRRRFLAWAKFDPARVRVLPNTVSEKFGIMDRSAARSAFGLGNYPAILTVGRLAATERYKGHDRILHCLAGLRNEFPGLIYLIAGTGDDQSRLEALAQELAVSESVRFLGDVSADDLPKLYNAADLFVMPSTGEGFGIVFLEAMACGTPALGLDADGSPDPLRDGEMGFLTSAHDLQNAIEMALRIPRPPNLAERTRACFGKQVFASNVARLLKQMQLEKEAPTCAV